MQMKAAVYERYGPPEVVQIREVEKPEPKPGEVRVKVHAATMHTGDTILRSLNVPGPAWQKLMARLFMGLGKPRNPILGMELAGEVEAIGEGVRKYRVGDAVFASTLWSNMGAHAEYKCLAESLPVLAKKPTNLSYEQSAALPSGALTALRCLRKASIQRGQQVLIYGASGNAGSYAVQLAAQLGAQVSGVCSTRNLEMVRSLGAERVLDYTAPDFELPARAFDVVFDAVGKLPRNVARLALKPSGTYLNIHKDSGGISDPFEPQDMLYLKHLAEAGELRAFIDRRYPLEQIIEAHRYVDAGHKRGNVIITMPAGEPV